VEVNIHAFLVTCIPAALLYEETPVPVGWEQMKSRLNPGNTWDQNTLSSRLLSRNVQIKIYRTVVVQYLLFCMGVKRGLSNWGNNTQWGCLRTGCLEEYKKDKVTEGWRKFHNEELHNLYTSPNIIRMIKSRRMWWAGHMVRMGVRNVYTIFSRIWGTIFVGKHEGKRPLGRPRRRWEDNIKMDLGETEWEVVNWIHVA
jgi:hypothetical protein